MRRLKKQKSRTDMKKQQNLLRPDSWQTHRTPNLKYWIQFKMILYLCQIHHQSYKILIKVIPGISSFKFIWKTYVRVTCNKTSNTTKKNEKKCAWLYLSIKGNSKTKNKKPYTQFMSKKKWINLWLTCFPS